MELTVNGRAVPAKMSVKTLMLYEQEFSSDMVADLQGKVRANDEEEGVLFDFTRVPWLKIIQGAWAMMKTADDSLPHFQRWAEDITEVNTFEFRTALSDAVSDAFFHIAATPDEEPGE